MKLTKGSAAATSFSLLSLLPSPVIHIAIAVVENWKRVFFAALIAWTLNASCRSKGLLE